MAKTQLIRFGVIVGTLTIAGCGGQPVTSKAAPSKDEIERFIEANPQYAEPADKSKDSKDSIMLGQ